MSDALRTAASRPATLEDVARVAGVSRSTVSRVINGIRNVDTEIQETVRQAIAATGYVPNSAARSLVTRRAGSIALILSGVTDEVEDEEHARNRVLTDPFFGRALSGVIGALRPFGLHPLLMVADTAQARDQVVGHLKQGGADGAILVSTDADDPLPARLVEVGLPAVLFARPVRPIPISYVDLANRDGARLAADHLAARGCRTVVVIGGPAGVPAAEDRLTGFREAMARHGFPYVPCVEGNFTQRGGEIAMERLLAEHPDLDGVFAANDLMAQGAMFTLREHGRRIPEDTAVIGFDDSSAALASRPQLTTVRQPVEDMAAELTRLLLGRVEDPSRAVTSVIFEPTLVIRQSA
ncbi:LacI family DNA-binding transcriptional regulator [Kitasatospora sp. NPDC057223]|uniref:LacI family DNA-binding transcriptional regulator n=1 Tax=Kitasatospora sp. NPDC057223 TaxID=3346055 RepID=UPI00362C9D71